METVPSGRRCAECGAAETRGNEGHTVFIVLGGLALLCAGFFGGMIIDRVRFDAERDAVLQPYREALDQRNRAFMEIEAADHARRSAAEVPAP